MDFMLTVSNVENTHSSRQRLNAERKVSAPCGQIMPLSALRPPLDILHAKYLASVGTGSLEILNQSFVITLQMLLPVP